MNESLEPELAEVFGALADPTRLQVVGRLLAAGRPMTVTEVTACCGVHISGVSRHLARLRAVGLVRAERRGREVRYELDVGSFCALLRGLADSLERCGASCCREEGT